MKLVILVLTASLMLLAAPSSVEAAKLCSLFSNHMVLQRDQPIPVWGWANPGEQVIVEFAGQKKVSQAGSNGDWLLRLDPLPASTEGRDLIVRSDEKTESSTITNVVVGDVWLCSGQSNMHFTMDQVENAHKEMAAQDNPALRFFVVGHQFAQQPAANVMGQWQMASPTTVAECSAVAYFFGRDLQKELGVPVGLIVSSVGGTRIETWMRREVLAATGESISLVEKWKSVSKSEFESIAMVYRNYQHERDREHPIAVKAAIAQSLPVPPAPKMPKQRCHDCPSALHHGMIAPLQPFAIRGAIWYQGESNASQPASYEKLLPAMIADWRQVWGKDLPFFFVQLAPHRNTHPAFREAQYRIQQKTPRTAMVVTTDVGDALNIHPTRKRPVGERLALAARAIGYGEPIEYSGPVFDGMKIEGSRIVISFKHVGDGLMTKGNTLTGFTLAGTDGKFIPADAAIEGENVIVTSKKISKPKSVRFAWAMVPDANLFNQNGLPATPFRTDATAGLTPEGRSE